MRTTITLPDGLLAQAKKRANQEGVTLSALVVAAVRDRVLRPVKAPGSADFRLVEFGQGGLRSGLSWGQLKQQSEDEDAERTNDRTSFRAADGK